MVMVSNLLFSRNPPPRKGMTPCIPPRRQLFGSKLPASCSAPAGAGCLCLPCCSALRQRWPCSGKRAALAGYSQCRKGFAPLEPDRHENNPDIPNTNYCIALVNDHKRETHKAIFSALNALQH